jgi:putative ABC transport system ATP-binding protein
MIELINTNKTYSTNKNDISVALEKVNLKINEGEVVVLRGSSGSGKSTILSLIAALLKPTSGELIVDKKHISKLSDTFASEFRREHIGFVFQKYNLVADLSVKENILLPLIPLNLPSQEMQKKLDIVVNKFHIEHKVNELVKNLSGGEQQRVAIARANINNPKIILADEPTANLDEELSVHLIKILQELKDEGKTIVVATHDPLFFDLDFVDQEIKIHKGQIL